MSRRAMISLNKKLVPKKLYHELQDDIPRDCEDLDEVTFRFQKYLEKKECTKTLWKNLHSTFDVSDYLIVQANKKAWKEIENHMANIFMFLETYQIKLSYQGNTYLASELTDKYKNLDSEHFVDHYRDFAVYLDCCVGLLWIDEQDDLTEEHDVFNTALASFQGQLEYDRASHG
jgi:hypothetical protein